MIRNHTNRTAPLPAILSPIILLIVAVAVGATLGAAVGILARAIPDWSAYRLVFVLLVGLGFLGAIVAGGVHRVLIIALVFAIPLNLPFDPFGEVAYHPGGAWDGFILYPYDFPLIALTLLLVAETLAGKRPFRVSRIDVVVILFIVWSILSIYSSSHISLSAFEILRMGKLYLLARIIAGLIRTRSDIHYLLIALLAGLVVQGVIGLFQYTTGTDFGLELYTVGNLRRVSGTVGWPNTYGTYAAAILSLGFSLWVFGADSRLRLPAIVASILGVSALVISFSRGAWISLVASMLVILLLAWRTGRLSKKALFRIAGSLVVVATIAMLFSGSISSRISEVRSDLYVLSDRMKLNQVAMNMIRSRPILGVGINTFVNEMGGFDTTGISAYFPQPVHNVYLLVAAETGLIGLLLFICLLVVVLQDCLKLIRGADHFLAVCGIGVLSSLVVLMVSNLADDHLRTEVLYGLFWVLIGLTIALRDMQLSVGMRGSAVRPRTDEIISARLDTD